MSGTTVSTGGASVLSGRLFISFMMSCLMSGKVRGRSEPVAIVIERVWVYAVDPEYTRAG